MTDEIKSISTHCHQQMLFYSWSITYNILMILSTYALLMIYLLKGKQISVWKKISQLFLMWNDDIQQHKHSIDGIQQENHGVKHMYLVSSNVSKLDCCSEYHKQRYSKHCYLLDYYEPWYCFNRSCGPWTNIFNHWSYFWIRCCNPRFDRLCLFHVSRVCCDEFWHIQEFV